MPAEPLLSELCGICKNEPPKYCCPRCYTLTCTLPCYKRHKLWSQCSGRRDVSERVKNHPAITPSAVDHDFNYLTSVERLIDDAYKSHAGKVDPRRGRKKIQAAQAAGFDRRIVETKVFVCKAPQGLSRQKNNQSRWVASINAIQWTLEWVLPDGTRKLGSCLDTTPLLEALQTLCDDSEPAPKRKKRKKHMHSSVATNASVAKSNLTAEPNEQTPTRQEQYDFEKCNFYLFKPRTVGSTKVLVPVGKAATLFHCLNHQEVLEFPTIYVTETPPESLPSGFQVEDVYMKSRKKMIQELEDDLGILDGTASDHVADEPVKDEAAKSTVGTGEVLQSLERDINYVKQHAM